MIRLAVPVISLLALSSCGQASGEPPERQGYSPAPEITAQGGVIKAAQPPEGTPPLNNAEKEAPPAAAQEEAGDPLDLMLDGLPPIQTGPMAATGGPGIDELAAERQAQLNLPRANHPLWDTLRQTRIAIDEGSQLFTASHPAPVRAMAGRRVTVRGYMLPLEATDRTGHFLISPYTPVCFFHPPAEPNEVIEVRLSRPIEAGYHLVEVTGVLRLANDGEKGLFFVIPEASARIVERVVA